MVSSSEWLLLEETSDSSSSLETMEKKETRLTGNIPLQLQFTTEKCSASRLRASRSMNSNLPKMHRSSLQGPMITLPAGPRRLMRTTNFNRKPMQPQLVLSLHSLVFTGRYLMFKLMKLMDNSNSNNEHDQNRRKQKYSDNDQIRSITIQ